MTWLRWICFAAGAVTVLTTYSGLVSAFILPRRGRSTVQRIVARGTLTVFNGVAERFPTYAARDRILAYQAPFFLLALLAVWLSLFLVGFALLLYPFVGGGGFTHALVESGSSLFTLGFASDSGVAPRMLILFAAATGLVVVALQIAYLPVIYGAFNRRETLVTMLEGRAGAPSWGPELLARHELVDNVESLGRLYESWEVWAADVAESHSTYPVLVWFRSPHPQRSWVLGLLSVLDAAAIHLATRPLSAPPQARPLMRMGYMALRDLAVVVGYRVNEDPNPDSEIELSKQSFMDAMHRLEDVGWPFERDPEEAWIHFRGWRVNYEDAAYRLADAVNAPPALWAGLRRRLPEHLQPPERPPHREPSGEILKVKETTRQRRAVRQGTAVPARRAAHDHHLAAQAERGLVHPAEAQKLADTAADDHAALPDDHAGTESQSSPPITAPE